jgi:hypothetical protein
MRLMNEPLVDQYLQERLSDKVSGLDNTTRPRVISLLRAVPTAWEFLSTFQQEQMRTIVNTIDITIPANVEIVAAAAHVTGLRELAKRRLSTLDNAQLADLATRYASEEIYDVAISEFEGIGAYADAAPSLRILVLPFVAHFSLDQVRRVLNAFRNNDQIYGAHFYMGPPMVDLLQNAPHAAQLETDWREIKRMLSAGHFVNEPQWNSFRERLEEAFPG